MKKIFSTITLFFIFAAAMAQSSSIKKANKFFEKRDFNRAIEIYENEPKTKETLQNLGDAYFYTNEIKKAASTYSQLFKNHADLDTQYHFRYAQTLKGTGDYEKADEIISEKEGKQVHTLQSIEKIDENSKTLYEVRRIKENSEFSDFGAAFLGNKVIFASGRNVSRPTYDWNNEPYLDLYIAEMGKNGGLANIFLFSSSVNTDRHESSATFSTNGNIMYFDRTNDEKVKIDDAKIATIQIMKAQLINGQWDNIKPVSFSSPEYSVEHPRVSPDGKQMFFSSDMPGGYGSFDIYVVDINSDGTFGKPKNLGPEVNTDQREQFPFINENNELFFASDGHLVNLGGLDIYKSKRTSDKFSTAINLGSSINSNKDDFAYAMSPEYGIGYFSSNRKGVDDLYSFSKMENFIVEGTVKDLTTNKALPGVKITLYDADGNELESQTTVNAATFSFDLLPNKTYSIKSTKNGYEPFETTFTTNSDSQVTSLSILMESYDSKEEIIVYDQIELENIYFDFNRWEITPKATVVLDELVSLLKKYPEMEIEIASHTDVRGPAEYNRSLSQKRAASTLEYLVEQGIDRSRLTSEGYGESKPVNKCVREGICTDDEYDVNRRSEFTILK